jgi:DNA-binding NtrC family response regulator
VLQEGEIDRVGGTETVKVDVRVLTTTNRDLAAWVAEGHFRQDLYFRLNVIPLRLPALRERGDDLLELAAFFIDMYVREYRLAPTALSPEAVDWLRTHDWPGNVRELQNLMERAVLLAGGKAIGPRHFLLENEEWPLFEEDEAQAPASGADVPDVPSGSGAGAALPWQPAPGSGTGLDGALIPLHEMERLMIQKGLEATSGNRTQAAELLGISVRTLRNKLNEYRDQGLAMD